MPQSEAPASSPHPVTIIASILYIFLAVPLTVILGLQVYKNKKEAQKYKNTEVASEAAEDLIKEEITQAC